ncbi:MAG: hypothetical protein CMF80_06995 [Candidatus Marinimicrobia bacterium]|nr:hypothetical protein [Candidatus Neomarinimicrobiota bacterium]
MTINFWINDPAILVDTDYISELWPMEFMSFNQKLNSLSRLIIILSILGFIIFNSYKHLFIGISVLIVIIVVKYSKSNVLEEFTSGGSKEIETEKDILLDEEVKEYKKPTSNNPLGNVLLTDYQDNPGRKPAPPAYHDDMNNEINIKTKEMIKEINNNNVEIEKKLFQDLGNNTMFDYSMRNFYSTANTEIPNDQQSFKNFLYGDLKSTKDGSLLVPK